MFRRSMLIGGLAIAAIICSRVSAQIPTAPDPLAANVQKLYEINHPWAQFAIDSAAKTTTTARLYGDVGEWGADAYLMTGEQKYADAALSRILPIITAEPTGGNQVRETFIEYALWYPWLKPALTSDQDAAYQKGLNRWSEWCLAINTPKYVGGFRTTDSDQTIGQYLGLMLVDKALGTGWTAKADAGIGLTGGPLPREAIRQYIAKAKGGEWIESSEYNLGTPSLLFMGIYALGIDKFPEAKDLAAEIAQEMVFSLTPDLKQAYQWGDEEHPRDLRLFNRIELLAMVAGISGDKQAHAAVTALAATLPLKNWLFLGWRALYFYQPLPQEVVMYLHASTGNGHFRYKRGNVMFGAHFPSRISVDHEVGYFGDFQLYKDGEWAITHPLGYGGKMVMSEANNSALLAGLSSMQNRGVTSYSETPTGCKITGETSGPYYAQPYYNPPDAFADWVRTVTYTYPGKIEVKDHFTGNSPNKLDRYRAADQTTIKNAPALWQQVFHAPVQPTETPDGYTWALPSGKTVKLTSPVGIKRLVLKETDVLTGTGTYVDPLEIKGYEIRFLSDAPNVELVAILETK